jgi:hypothetical protein
MEDTRPERKRTIETSYNQQKNKKDMRMRSTMEKVNVSESLEPSG